MVGGYSESSIFGEFSGRSREEARRREEERRYVMDMAEKYRGEYAWVYYVNEEGYLQVEGPFTDEVQAQRRADTVTMGSADIVILQTNKHGEAKRMIEERLQQ